MFVCCMGSVARAREGPLVAVVNLWCDQEPVPRGTALETRDPTTAAIKKLYMSVTLYCRNKLYILYFAQNAQLSRAPAS